MTAGGRKRLAQSPAPALTEADRDALERLGIDRWLLEAAGIRRVTTSQARDDCGIRYKSDRLAGLWFPNFDPVTGRVRGGRVRRDHPDVENGQPKTKYVASMDRHRLYFPPGAAPLLEDRAVSVVVVEAEKSVLAIVSAAARASRRVLAIDLGGCGNWKGTIGTTIDAGGARVPEKGPNADLDRVSWRDRDVVLLADANAAANDNVRIAYQQLKAELAGRGAKVRIAVVPREDDVNGPDDYIGRHGDAAAFALIDSASASRTPHWLPIIVRLADVRPESVTWLWPRRVAAGKLALLVGDPGLGKSWITLDVAARVSSGGEWPDGGVAIDGDVVLLSAEDGLADTIRPRLDALGANVKRIHHLAVLRAGDSERGVQLADIAALEQAIHHTGARLLVIDPMSAYHGSTDSHRDAEVRGLMAPLALVAERTGVAILGVMHLAKGAQRPAIYRAVGSIAFAAAARIVLAVAADPERDDRRIMAPIKSNLSTPPAALAYMLTDGGLTWLADPVSDVDINALLAGPWQNGEDRRQADAWLRELLRDGEMQSRQIEEAASDAGIPRRTLFRAKARLHIDAVRIGGVGAGGQWYWRLPKSATKGASDDEVALLGADPVNTAEKQRSDAKSATSDGVAPLAALLGGGLPA
jgi:hypothetical protein